MVNYREILRLNSLKYTQMDISTSLKTSRNTIREVIKLAKEKEMKCAEAATLSIFASI